MSGQLRLEPHTVGVEHGPGFRLYRCACGVTFDTRTEYEEHLFAEANRAARLTRRIRERIARHLDAAEHYEAEARRPLNIAVLRSGAHWDAAQRERDRAEELRALLTEEDR